MRLRAFYQVAVAVTVAGGLAACAASTSPQEQVVVGAQPGAVTTTVTIPTALTTVHPAFVTAWQGTDPNALQVYYTDNATIVTPAGQFAGFHDFHTKWLTTTMPNLSKFTLTPVNFTTEGDVIVETGNLAYVLSKDGTPTNVTGTYMHRWQKQSDGSWRLVSVEIK